MRKIRKIRTLIIIVVMMIISNVLPVSKNVYANTNSYSGLFGGTRIYKYEDINLNGEIDGEDKPVEGFKFILDFYNSDGSIAISREASTNKDGYFIIEDVEGVYEFIQQNVSPSYPFPISGNVNPIRIYPKNNQGFKDIKSIADNNLPGNENQKRLKYIDEDSDGSYDYVEYKHTAIYHNIMAAINTKEVYVSANNDPHLDKKNTGYVNGEEAAFEVYIENIGNGLNKITTSVYNSGVVGEGEAVVSSSEMNMDLTTPEAIVLFMRTHKKDYIDKKSGDEISETSSLRIRDLELNGEDLNGSSEDDIYIEDGKPHQFVIKYDNLYSNNGNGALHLTGKYQMTWNKHNITTNEDITGNWSPKNSPVFYIKGVPYHSLAFLGTKDETQFGQVQFKKVDSENKEEVLEGAEFTIYEQTAEGGKGAEIVRLTTKADGLTDLHTLILGKYIAEETKAPNGYNLSGELIPFEVTKDNNNEIIQFEVENTKIFIEPVSAIIEAFKILQNKELESGMFEFELLDEAGNVLQRTTNNEDGTIVFDKINFENEGIYKYTVREVSGYLEGITYDSRVFDVTINVNKDTEHKLNAEIIYDNNKIEFINTYTDKPVITDPEDEDDDSDDNNNEEDKEEEDSSEEDKEEDNSEENKEEDKGEGSSVENKEADTLPQTGKEGAIFIPIITMLTGISLLRSNKKK